MMKKLLKVTALSLEASTLLTAIPAQAEESTGIVLDTSSQLSTDYTDDDVAYTEEDLTEYVELIDPLLPVSTGTNLPGTGIYEPDKVVGDFSLGTSYKYMGSYDSTSKSFDNVSALIARFSVAFGLTVYAIKNVKDDVAKAAISAGSGAIMSTY